MSDKIILHLATDDGQPKHIRRTCCEHCGLDISKIEESEGHEVTHSRKFYESRKDSSKYATCTSVQ